MFIQMHKKNKRMDKNHPFPLKGKKAVSEMIGYILLITFAIVIAVVVFQWLKTYVPKEGIACPDEVSIYISEYNSSTSGELSLILKNNGQFGIGGIYIYYSNNSNQTIAPYDLSKKIKDGGISLNPGISLGPAGNNDFAPNEDKTIIFDISQIDYIYSVEITPIRWQEEKNKKPLVSCANAKTKKILNLNFIQETESGGISGNEL